jgi:two-component system NarL family sensor kinase
VVGWLFIADGLGHATSALAAPFAQVVHDQGGPESLQRFAVTVHMYAWPWSIGLFLPLSLLLFPDGRPVSRAWRVVTWAVAGTSPLFVLAMGLGTEPVSEGLPVGYLTAGWYDNLAPLWTVAELRTSAALLLDIRLVLSRALVWMLLSLGALARYVVLVAALDTFVTARFGRSALVTVLVAVGLAPLLPRVQRLVNRWMYGDRDDPRVASRVGEHLVSGDQ